MSHYGGKKSTARIIRDLIGERERETETEETPGCCRAFTDRHVIIHIVLFFSQSKCGGTLGGRERRCRARLVERARSINHRAKLFRKRRGDTPRVERARRRPVIPPCSISRTKCILKKKKTLYLDLPCVYVVARTVNTVYKEIDFNDLFAISIIKVRLYTYRMRRTCSQRMKTKTL